MHQSLSLQYNNGGKNWCVVLWATTFGKMSNSVEKQRRNPLTFLDILLPSALVEYSFPKKKKCFGATDTNFQLSWKQNQNKSFCHITATVAAASSRNRLPTVANSFIILILHEILKHFP